MDSAGYMYEEEVIVCNESIKEANRTTKNSKIACSLR